MTRAGVIVNRLPPEKQKASKETGPQAYGVPAVHIPRRHSPDVHAVGVNVEPGNQVSQQIGHLLQVA